MGVLQNANKDSLIFHLTQSLLEVRTRQLRYRHSGRENSTKNTALIAGVSQPLEVIAGSSYVSCAL